MTVSRSKGTCFPFNVQVFVRILLLSVGYEVRVFYPFFFSLSKPIRIFAGEFQNMDGELRFKIKYLKEALEFINSLPEKVQDKVTYNIGKCQVRIDPDLFSKLSGSDIWEFRTLYDGIAYRLFAF